MTLWVVGWIVPLSGKGNMEWCHGLWDGLFHNLVRVTGNGVIGCGMDCTTIW